MIRSALSIPILFLLTACGGMVLPVQLTPGSSSPSPAPAIQSPTSPFVPSATSTSSGSGSPTATETPTLTETPTVTLNLLLEILGCNTSLDITHGMGEVTNAYPLLKNYTLSNLTTVCATLTASDEDRAHPDKAVCIPILPAGSQVLLELTVDTGFQEDTSIQVDVTDLEGQNTSMLVPSCRALGFPGWIPDEIGVVKPIP